MLLSGISIPKLEALAVDLLNMTGKLPLSALPIGIINGLLHSGDKESSNDMNLQVWNSGGNHSMI